jgi:hypothetical protein
MRYRILRTLVAFAAAGAVAGGGTAYAAGTHHHGRAVGAPATTRYAGSPECRAQPAATTAPACEALSTAQPGQRPRLPEAPGAVRCSGTVAALRAGRRRRRLHHDL